MIRRGTFCNHRTLMWLIACVASTALLMTSCGKVREDVKEGEGLVLGMETYVYGFPLVVMDLTRQVMTATPTAGELAAPINQFQRLRTIVPWNFNNVVRISTNSLWSTSFLDLEKEPLILSIPDTKGRPIAMRVMNMWTDVFGTAGSRTPEMNAGDYLITGPGWKGSAPANIKKVFSSSTRYAWVLIEQSIAGPADFAPVHLLQDQLKVTPLSAWGKPYAPPAVVPVDANVDLTATPYDQVRLMTGEMFFKHLATLLKDNPPYAADTAMLEKLKRIGVQPGKEFNPGAINPGLRKGINDAPARVWLKFATGPYGMKSVNGWINMLNIAKYGSDYQTRAYVAYMGLGAGLAADIVYPTAFVDSNGEALDGTYRYVMHFDKSELPASRNGVWSISAYRENFYVHNSIDRYGLLPDMPKSNPDGSLDVYLQATSPGPDKESNWLPIPPSGTFNLTIRIYDPKKEALDPAYKIPPVRKVQPAVEEDE